MNQAEDRTDDPDDRRIDCRSSGAGSGTSPNDLGIPGGVEFWRRSRGRSFETTQNAWPAWLSATSLTFVKKFFGRGLNRSSPICYFPGNDNNNDNKPVSTVRNILQTFFNGSVTIF